MRIAVVSAKGQLGAAVVRHARQSHEVVPFERATLDVTDTDAVLAALTRVQPDAIINCSGYNFVDAAETHPVDAMQVNGFAVRAMARAANLVGARLVHYSTDFVFDGAADAPYRETDRPNPQSVYAASKLIGEWFALEAPRSYALRVERDRKSTRLNSSHRT